MKNYEVSLLDFLIMWFSDGSAGKNTAAMQEIWEMQVQSLVEDLGRRKGNPNASSLA